ncbi:hypothetical protein [Streptomyces boninensis]|uniref:hypothetical protein n=1 Tax=Streptomyces boninensis TaxID=2039455 RepID=UPI003B225C94
MENSNVDAGANGDQFGVARVMLGINAGERSAATGRYRFSRLLAAAPAQTIPAFA